MTASSDAEQRRGVAFEHDGTRSDAPHMLRCGKPAARAATIAIHRGSYCNRSLARAPGRVFLRLYGRCGRQRRITPISKVTRKITTKMKNSTFAISDAPAAMPPKPNTAAMMAMTKKIAAYRSMRPPTDELLD
ncbi:hypothetical protein BUPH_01779 [Paraburkholderia phenoliruptrix BR3459a]|uniref:Uncharacterized protein n=1 Tax=Paraburkholderia phenoliruptrix BR3459a TaxID=1229205 RepID=K0DKL8_9BURK|nr:hypothetical protein BUPH_01779 [Paraburkholderia phenoliruptrix BR3459a]